jgi:anti-sigma regulatory factor (Ser/Thr protein kinase)
VAVTATATVLQLRIRESSEAGEARRGAAARAASLGFAEERAGRVALVVSELATNLVKHAQGGGELFVSPVERGSWSGLEIVAMDRGPGVADVSAALRDGYSTAGSAGTGLGAVSRVSDEFDFYSTRGTGTIVVARIWSDAPAQRSSAAVAGICSSKEGEQIAGDAFAVAEVDGRTRIIVADGLGHGPDANRAASEAVRVFRKARGSLTETLETIHQALRPTRGAAVSLVEIDPGPRTVAYAGVGNIGAAIVASGQTRSLVSHNGTLGHAIRRIQEFGYELPEGAFLVLHSDGLKSRWSLDGYAGIGRRDPLVVAAALYRDFARGRDDATAVVARLQ